MDIHQFEYFMSIASGMTFWAAAEKHHISQSGLSKSISNLEKELDIELFHRIKQHVVLTKAGEYLYNWLKEIEPQVNSLKQNLSKYSNSLSLLVVPSIIELGLSNHIMDFSNIFPDCKLLVEEGISTKKALESLQNHRYDFIFTHNIMVENSKFSSLQIFYDPLIVLLPGDHPMAGHETVFLNDLANNNFLLTGRSSSFLPILSKILGSSFKYSSIKGNRIEMAFRVASHEGLALYFASEINHMDFETSSVFPCVVGDFPDASLSLVWNRDDKLSKNMQEFIEYISNCNILNPNDN